MQKIEQAAEKKTHENFVIFFDKKAGLQTWLWARRTPGKGVRYRYITGDTNKSCERLVQTLIGIAIALEEEEDTTITHVSAKVRQQFDVETTSRKFYDAFRAEHSKFIEFIQGLNKAADKDWYASLMLNRLMFVYFFQKQGFLDNNVDYLKDRLRLVQERRGSDQFLTFYRYFLLRLFHFGLGSQKDSRPEDLEDLLGDVPYLNGGLFEPHELEINNPDIQIPDEAFERLFDFFKGWDWHLDSRKMSSGKEINPDVLGHIFEKYINQKQMGAYYTKEDITGYISSSTIIPFLLHKLQNIHPAAISGLLKKVCNDPDPYIAPDLLFGTDIDLPPEIADGISDTGKRQKWNTLAEFDYALPDETWREHIRRRQMVDALEKRCSAGFSSIDDLVTSNFDLNKVAVTFINHAEPEELLSFYESLTKITVLDPTCGSGAFLFAALNVLQPMYNASLERMRNLSATGTSFQKNVSSEFERIFAEIGPHENANYFILKSIIINNLFGVDIMKEAVEICKLRLFLKLVAQLKTRHEIEPLPDIDFNIRSGNTLIGFSSKQALEATQVKMNFGISVDQIIRAAEKADGAYHMFVDVQSEVDSKKLVSLKTKLRNQLEPLRAQLDQLTAENIKYGLSQDSETYAAWLEAYQPFHWFIEFYGIMSRGGFDVIIGNPPYVEYRKVQAVYALPKDEYLSEQSKNLYAFCMERCTKLVSKQGRFGMIVPAGLLGLDDAAPLRKLLLACFKANWFSTYAIRPSKLFDVDQRLCIHIAAATPAGQEALYSSRYHHWNANERKSLFQLLRYEGSFLYPELNRIPQVGSPEALSILTKLRARQQKPISSYYSRTGSLLHYHRSPRYWIRAMDFEQYFKSATKAKSVHHFRDLHFVSPAIGKVAGSIINSTLFFFWFVSVGNGRNITGSDVEKFPVGDISKNLIKTLEPQFDALMNDLKKNSFVRTRKDCEFQEFNPKLSKPIVDKIDTSLATLYDFTSEELDFLINYDIKYRDRAEEEDSSED